MPVGAHTIASYRDTFELLLRYAEKRTGRTPSALRLEDLDAPLVLAFLDHLKTERGHSPRTRNLRLTAIRSFMRHASLRAPAALPVAERVLAISPKRFDRPALDFLSREEVEALLEAPDRGSCSGQRDAVLFAVLYNSGARVSELVGLRVADLLLDRAHGTAATTTPWRFAANTRGPRLQVAERRAEIERPPAPSTLPLVVAGAAPPAHPAAPALLPVSAAPQPRTPRSPRRTRRPRPPSARHPATAPIPC